MKKDITKKQFVINVYKTLLKRNVITEEEYKKLVYEKQIF